MIRISQLRLPCGSDTSLLEEKIRKLLRPGKGETMSFRISRHSIDARKRPHLEDVYSVDVALGSSAREKKAAQRARSRNVQYMDAVQYTFPAGAGDLPENSRPVVVGFGPAGIFCALMLSRAGFRPIVLERGAEIPERSRIVGHFWKTGELDPECNIQFGEGGAGTYSDGKLTTGIRDSSGRIEEVLRTFVEAGAPEDILYENLPHIGTDCLRNVILNLRREIEALGGEVRFRCRMTGLQFRDSRITGVEYLGPDGRTHVIETPSVALAPGHSARDTFRMLKKYGIPMSAKSFAVGFRVSHPQKLIDERTYGTADPLFMENLSLPHASYKLAASLPSGRRIYSFCMCPGGYVVNASSQNGFLAVNGMSDRARGADRANSAIIMPVEAASFDGDDPLAGMYYQEQLEKKAWALAGGRIPLERYADFRDALSGNAGGASPCTGSSDEACRPLTEKEAEGLCVKGLAAKAPLHGLFPPDFGRDFTEGMEQFDRTIPGFAGEDAWVLGLESRTSSPVRILRDDSLESVLRGLSPCGEGAGYAGGIVSAAVDGIRVAEAVAQRLSHKSRQ